jgi:hypothetical protein
MLQRLALVDATTDREVWMLYSFFLRALGPGLIWAYEPQAPAIAWAPPTAPIFAVRRRCRR